MVYLSTKIFAEPLIKINHRSSELAVNDEFLSVTVRLYPELVLYCGDEALVVIYLGGYLESETLYFEDKTAPFEIVKTELVNELATEIKRRLISSVKGRGAEQLSEDIRTEVSFLAFVEYQALATSHVNRACFVEQNGSFIEISNYEKNRILKERLYVYEINLRNAESIDALEEDINAVIEAVTPEVERIYGAIF